MNVKTILIVAAVVGVGYYLYKKSKAEPTVVKDSSSGINGAQYLATLEAERQDRTS